MCRRLGSWMCWLSVVVGRVGLGLRLAEGEVAVAVAECCPLRCIWLPVLTQ